MIIDNKYQKFNVRIADIKCAKFFYLKETNNRCNVTAWHPWNRVLVRNGHAAVKLNEIDSE